MIHQWTRVRYLIDSFFLSLLLIVTKKKKNVKLLSQQFPDAILSTTCKLLCNRFPEYPQPILLSM